MIAGREHALALPAAVAYVIIVERRVQPHRAEASARLIERRANNSRTLEGVCLAFGVGQDLDDCGRFGLYEANRDQARHPRHLEMASYQWFRATATNLVVPGPETTLPASVRC